jgi:nucleolar protein 56
VPTNVFGEILQKQVEDRLKFYDSGTLPPKNAEIMAGAVLKAEEAKNEILKKEKKKKKKAAKKNKDESEEIMLVETITTTTTTNGHAKSNGSNGVETHLEDMTIQEDVVMESPSKKKKKKKNNKD